MNKEFDEEKWSKIDHIIVMIICYSDGRQLYDRFFTNLEKAKSSFSKFVKRIEFKTNIYDKYIKEAYLICVETDKRNDIISGISRRTPEHSNREGKDVEPDLMPDIIMSFSQPTESSQFTIGTALYSWFS